MTALSFQTGGGGGGGGGEDTLNIPGLPSGIKLHTSTPIQVVIGMACLHECNTATLS